MSENKQIDLSVMIMTRNEAGCIGDAVTGVKSVCDRMDLSYEVIVVDGASTDATAEVAAQAGAEVIQQKLPGYGGALVAGFERAKGERILTQDADLSHPPEFIQSMWDAAQENDMVIASRYVPGGKATMPVVRYLLSSILNRVFGFVLRIPILDMSSGFRLYRKSVLDTIDTFSPNFDMLQHILVGIYRAGYKVKEVPFHYQPRKEGASKARVFAFGISYIKTLWTLRKIKDTRKQG
jgi:dolichol-phosphate mannosyltransferase